MSKRKPTLLLAPGVLVAYERPTWRARLRRACRALWQSIVRRQT
ncbi:hypothetical protein [Vandammella animalimorsus]|nr:hypothetical protein [Vandammella animalimorsus]